ncbi:MAG: hypothetical protein DME76_12625 [Verrucomicrobia bacterium]|nr:MAG: hypothetical protein DME76_12625 [Verrucomicrobiota bacterium]
MKWFQQNRELGTLLVGCGIGVLLAAALLFWRWSAWSGARQAFDRAAAEQSRLAHLDPFPNDANDRKLQGYLKSYTAALDKFKEQLKTEVAAAPPLAPNEFQSRLRQATVATLDRARVNNVKLPDRFQLGFDEFARVMPGTAVAPLLGQELSQIQMLISILLDAKVDAVTAFRRYPLPEEHPASAKPTPTPPPAPGRKAPAARALAKPGATPAPALIERNVVDVSFKAAPGTARRVMNEIVSSTGQFFIIRTLYVHNEKDKGPPRQRAASPTPARQSAQAIPAQEGAPGALTFIVGTEQIEVSATIEMLRFTF